MEEMSKLGTMFRDQGSIACEQGLHGTEGLFFDTRSNRYMILEGGTPATPAHYAAILGRLDILKMMIYNNFCVSEDGKDQLNNIVSAENVAAINGYVHCAQLLGTKEAKCSGRSSNVGRNSFNTCILL